MYLFLFNKGLVNVINVVKVRQSLLGLAVVTLSHVLELLKDLNCLLHLRLHDASPGLTEVSLNQVDVFKSEGHSFDVSHGLDSEEASGIRTVRTSHF